MVDVDMIEPLFDFVFSPRGVVVTTESQFRRFLERGELYVDRLNTLGKALSGVIFGAFIEYVAMLKSMSTPPAGRYSKLTRQLWENNVCNKTGKISTWWESAVDFTSMSHSFVDTDDFSMAFNRPGGPLYIPRLSCRICLNQEEFFKLSTDPELAVAPPNFEGADSRVTFVSEGEMVFIYRQMKIQKSSSNSTLANIVANTIIGVMKKHLEVVSAAKSNLNFANVFVVFYMWSETEEVTVNELLAEVNNTWIAKKNLVELPQLKTVVEYYMNNFYETHVKIMFQEDLDDWLLPTFRVVPRIVESINWTKREVIENAIN
jgi:hypothetical protein